jgi:hypothetical protein
MSEIPSIGHSFANSLGIFGEAKVRVHLSILEVIR